MDDVFGLFGYLGFLSTARDNPDLLRWLPWSHEPAKFHPAAGIGPKQLKRKSCELCPQILSVNWNERSGSCHPLLSSCFKKIKRTCFLHQWNGRMANLQEKDGIYPPIDWENSLFACRFSHC